MLVEHRFLSSAMGLIDAIFIDRTNLRNAFEVYEKEKQAVKNRYAVCVSIEGGYKEGHEFLEYKKAVLRLAYECKIPIVPFLIYGSIGLSDKEQRQYLNHSRKVTLIAQPVLYHDQFMNIDPEVLSKNLHDQQEKLYFQLKQDSEKKYI
jgi:1-acyl-sn-glycerol-3-phosphate acyltransferase